MEFTTKVREEHQVTIRDITAAMVERSDDMQLRELLNYLQQRWCEIAIEASPNSSDMTASASCTPCRCCVNGMVLRGLRQRKALDARLAGRKPQATDYSDAGVPVFGGMG